MSHTVKIYPEPVLRLKCAPVHSVSKKELQLFDAMCRAMQARSGVGLAAPQIGEPVALIVVDVGDGPIKLANPTIVHKKGSIEKEEGCLSFPSVYVTIARAESVTVHALNENNQRIVLDAKGLLARALQHEIDHLHGKLIIDYVKDDAERAAMIQKIKRK